MAGDDRVKIIQELQSPLPLSAPNIITAIRNILKIAFTNNVSSISVVMRYTDATGKSVYSTFEEIAPGEVEEFW